MHSVKLNVEKSFVYIQNRYIHSIRSSFDELWIQTIVVKFKLLQHLDMFTQLFISHFHDDTSFLLSYSASLYFTTALRYFISDESTEKPQRRRKAGKPQPVFDN